MTTLSLTESKKALASTDPVVFARTYLQLIRKGASDSALFRLALSSDSTLTREEWRDRVQRATTPR